MSFVFLTLKIVVSDAMWPRSPCFHELSEVPFESFLAFKISTVFLAYLYFWSREGSLAIGSNISSEAGLVKGVLYLYLYFGEMR